MNPTNNFQHWDCTNLILLSNPEKKLGIPNPEEVCSKSWIRLARIRRVGTRLQLPHWELRNTGAEHSTNLCFSYSTRHSVCLYVEKFKFCQNPMWHNHKSQIHKAAEVSITKARFTKQLKFLSQKPDSQSSWSFYQFCRTAITLDLSWHGGYFMWLTSEFEMILNRWCMRHKVSINQSEL